MEGINLRNEYPRPDFQRKDWMSLNGKWEFGFNEVIHSEIEVPFVYQCALSGVNIKDNYDHVIYHKVFSVPDNWKDQNILLHFGAVDYKSTVYVNGHMVCNHEGGHVPFTIDITEFLNWSQEDLVVKVYDPHSDETIPRGKQYWNGEPVFIWYTPSTGIWQSVWLEPVSISKWERILFTPDIDSGTVEISYTLSDKTPLPCTCEFKITHDDKLFFKGEMNVLQKQGKFTVDIFANKVLRGPSYLGGLCWSPENPNLFDVEAVLLVDRKPVDQVNTYFGMRKISIENGKLYLNNMPYYHKLVLDQGYWEEGLLTAPDENAYKQDILLSKSMGFNGCRKHEKAEDPVFLYWADKLGYLVWGSVPSFISYTPDAVNRFIKGWSDIILRDYNHPSIVVWDMLNESWGVPAIYNNKMQQAFSLCLYNLAYSLDNTRLVVTNDGWEQTGGDLCTIHTYKHGSSGNVDMQEHFSESLKRLDGILDGTIMERLPYAKGYHYNGQPIIISEFGGVSCGAEEKSWDSTSAGSEEELLETYENSWGYTNAGNEEDFLKTYERLIQNIYASDLICGFCYTQFTDVQQEKNGLLTDKHTPKFNLEKIKKINDGYHK